MGLKWHLRA
uniref:Uncharacterized protein n=1 Tax=Leuconostoc citreum TaxID=33964 RepID=A0A0A1IRV4_LEUCI|nr:Protein of unknown function [Leuconostoc citreum]